MTNKELLKELREELDSLREEVRRSRSAYPPQPAYVPVYPQPSYVPWWQTQTTIANNANQIGGFVTTLNNAAGANPLQGSYTVHNIA